MEESNIDLLALGDDFYCLGFFSFVFKKAAQNTVGLSSMFQVLSLKPILPFNNSSPNLISNIQRLEVEEEQVDLEIELTKRNQMLRSAFKGIPGNWHCKLASLLFLVNSMTNADPQNKLNVFFVGFEKSFKSSFCDSIEQIGNQLRCHSRGSHTVVIQGLLF